MLLLVVSVSDKAEAPTIVDDIDTSKFVISQTEMLSIYEMITPAVNQSHTQYLARTLFGLTDTQAEEAEGMFVVNSGIEPLKLILTVLFGMLIILNSGMFHWGPKYQHQQFANGTPMRGYC
jgi:hypothetical protein